MPGTGVRQRLQPPLPPEYFGNAAQGEFVFMKARDQVEKRGIENEQHYRYVHRRKDKEVLGVLEKKKH